MLVDSVRIPECNPFFEKLPQEPATDVYAGEKSTEGHSWEHALFDLPPLHPIHPIPTPAQSTVGVATFLKRI